MHAARAYAVADQHPTLPLPFSLPAPQRRRLPAFPAPPGQADTSIAGLHQLSLRGWSTWAKRKPTQLPR